MNDHKILLTGDYWHADFQPIVSSFKTPTTLVPIEKIESVSDSTFDLIIIAQARRDQHSQVDVEKLHAIFPTTPVIAVLGSWCEGETRSGKPWPGVTRIYWHQWQGRYQNFIDQLSESGITEWHAPRTSTIGDRIAIPKAVPVGNPISCVAISAWTATRHQMAVAAIHHFGWRSTWIERGVWNAETITAVDAICIEADAWCSEVESRVKWIQSEVPNKPMVLLVNYPRVAQLKAINAAGIAEVVSKPFELVDLQAAIVRAVDSHEVAQPAETEQIAR